MDELIDISDEEMEAMGLADEPLRIRVDRDGSLDVSLAGVPLPVASIDIDDVSIDRLQRTPLTQRDRAT